MKERSLVAFTLLSQTAVGAFWVLGALHAWVARQAGVMAADALADKALLAVGPVMALSMLASFFHLGRPLSAWRAFANLRSSWLSREILFASLFLGTSSLFAGLQCFKLGSPVVRNSVAWLAALFGLGLIVSMANAYRLRTIPAWNTWVTLASFFITAFLLGGLAAGTTLMVNSDVPHEVSRSALEWIALGAIVLLGAELVVIPVWIAGLATGRGAALRAATRITQEYGLIFRLRLALTVAGLAVASLTLAWPDQPATLRSGVLCKTGIILAFGLVLVSEVLGRLLFYEARVRHGIS